ncbi:MAG: hypothetical protein KH295_12950 [Clostridiaceae bacterium]|nr:hypothetical protein [Clostridiaceae bacterium]
MTVWKQGYYFGIAGRIRRFAQKNSQNFGSSGGRDYAPDESDGRCFDEKRFFKIVMKS